MSEAAKVARWVAEARQLKGGDAIQAKQMLFDTLAQDISNEIKEGVRRRKANRPAVSAVSIGSTVVTILPMAMRRARWWKRRPSYRRGGSQRSGGRPRSRWRC